MENQTMQTPNETWSTPQVEAIVRLPLSPYFEQDGITIYNGDCREILPLLSDVDLMLTDPPYGIAYKAGSGKNVNAQRHAAIIGDDAHFDPSHLLAFSDVLLWGANNYCQTLPHGGQWYWWDKICKNGLQVRISEGEFAWHKCGTKPRGFRHMWCGHTYRDSERGTRRIHPSQKPVALMRWCIGLSKRVGTIVDPYCGSGSTLVAAKLEGRKAVGIEIDERYCEAAANRLKQRQLF